MHIISLSKELLYINLGISKNNGIFLSIQNLDNY